MTRLHDIQTALAVARADGLFTAAVAVVITPRECQVLSDDIADIDKLFDVASLTKPLVTAMLVHRAIDSGDCTLETVVNEILPSCPFGIL